MAMIYVGCALTQAPEEFIQFVLRIKELLRADGHEVVDFLGLTAGTPTDVYETDIHSCVASCSLMVGICDHPGIGLGWELATAVEKFGKPTLALGHVDSRISRLPIGAECERNPNFKFARYQDEKDIIKLVRQFLSHLELAAPLTAAI